MELLEGGRGSTSEGNPRGGGGGGEKNQTEADMKPVRMHADLKSLAAQKDIGKKSGAVSSGREKVEEIRGKKVLSGQEKKGTASRRLIPLRKEADCERDWKGPTTQEKS